MTVTVAIGPSSFGAPDDTPLRVLREQGITIRENPFKRRLTEEEIIAHLEGMHGLIAGLEPLNARVLEAASGTLKAVARVGVGMDNVDQEAARRLGIHISNTPDAPAYAVAELTFSVLLALLRRLVPLNEVVHTGQWQKIMGESLRGKTVLVVGYGRIARIFCDFLAPFETRLLVHDPFLQEPPKHGTAVETLEAGLREADVVSLHASGNLCLLDQEQFQAMRPGCILLNSARGELVSEAALLQALESGQVGWAWFDAFWKEPYTGPLQGHKQVLLTPHVGTYTAQCRSEMELMAAENLLRDLGLGR